MATKKEAKENKKILFIVESPGKIKKLSSFLGSNYIVKASYGHIRELEKNGVDKKNNFTPSYIISDDKKATVKELKDTLKKVDFTLLCSDADLEGESISWHLKEVLNLKESEYDRLTFNEITENAIKKALKEPRKIDMNRVYAQQARRVLDRLVGFGLSPVLWHKVQPKLSAGRVQSVAARIIVDREKEINKFESTSDFKVVGLFEIQDKKGKSVLVKSILNKRFKDKHQAEDFLKKCINQEFFVKSIETKPGKRSPSPPFITSSLQQEASRKLGFSADKTMSVAQKLYENAHISYMRVDSVFLSEEIISSTKAEITNLYGTEYSNSQQYKNKNPSQNAHEACRPTKPEHAIISGTNDEQRLYELIWKRTIASQMSDAKVERTTITIGSKNLKEEFVIKGEVVKFDGFLKVYMEDVDEKSGDEDLDDNKTLPEMIKGQALSYQEILAIESFTKSQPRYTEASLVKQLENLNIGRPSTYATILKTIVHRGYIEKKDSESKKRNVFKLILKNNKISEESKEENYGAEKAKLFPTDIGILVNDFLFANFPVVMDYGFTASVESDLDNIAEGTKIWHEVVGEFYAPLEIRIKEVSKDETKISEKLLGIDPVTKSNVFSRLGKFGPMVQLGDSVDKKDKDAIKPKFAKLKEGQKLDIITLKEALELLSWPKTLGEHKKEPVLVNIGKFGPYVKYKDKYYSIKEPHTIENVTLKEALEIIEEKDSNPTTGALKEFKSKGIKVLKGKYGPYINNGKKNFKIPSHIEVEKITLEDCLEIIKNAKNFKKKES